MSVFDWTELDRRRLAELLPGAVVMISTGAVEQHGEHLASGTDSFLAQKITRAAAIAAAEGGVDVVFAPPLWIGASDHHLPFGGTVSLRAETMLTVLIDVLASMARAGARRIMIVNGHGGNTGLCQAAAAATSARHEVAVGHLDYWQLVGQEPDALAPVPGHAGAFETSLMLAVRPDLVGRAADRDVPEVAMPTEFAVNSPVIWRTLDGWTDDPNAASATTGNDLLTKIAGALGKAVIEWSRTWKDR